MKVRTGFAAAVGAVAFAADELVVEMMGLATALLTEPVVEGVEDAAEDATFPEEAEADAPGRMGDGLVEGDGADPAGTVPAELVCAGGDFTTFGEPAALDDWVAGAASAATGAGPGAGWDSEALCELVVGSLLPDSLLR